MAENTPELWEWLMHLHEENLSEPVAKRQE
jgi:hypothetical protein